MRAFLAVVSALAILSSCTTTAGPQDKGFFLGQHDIDLSTQMARIVLDRYEGHLVAIQIVTDNDIVLHDLVIVYSNGEWESEGSDLTFSQGSRSRVITLHGWRPHIRAIQFAYSPLGEWTTGQTAVQVYGLGRND
jgi:hypothetical protein